MEGKSLTGRGKTQNKDLRTRACELCSKTSKEARVVEASKANKSKGKARESSTSHCLPHSQSPLWLSPTYSLGNHDIYHNPTPLGWGWQNIQVMLVGMESGEIPLESCRAIFENVKYRFTMRPSNSTPWYILKRGLKAYVYTKTCRWMYPVAFFIMPKGGNKPNVHQLINEWVKCELSNTMEYYLAIKRNKVLTHATTQIT